MSFQVYMLDDSQGTAVRLASGLNPEQAEQIAQIVRLEAAEAGSTGHRALPVQVVALDEAEFRRTAPPGTEPPPVGATFPSAVLASTSLGLSVSAVAGALRRAKLAASEGKQMSPVDPHAAVVRGVTFMWADEANRI